MNIQEILKQLQSKINEVQQLKTNIMASFPINNNYAILKQLFQQTIKPSIIRQLASYSKEQVGFIRQIQQKYNKHIITTKKMYENQIEQLKQQIIRQYKVIGMMKNQVQDLMILLTQQQEKIQEYSQNNGNLTKNQELSLLQKNSSLDLEVIQQQTQRTNLSSQQSDSKDNINNFIKIQEQKLSNYYSYQSGTQQCKLSRQMIEQRSLKIQQFPQTSKNNNDIKQKYNQSQLESFATEQCQDQSISQTEVKRTLNYISNESIKVPYSVGGRKIHNQQISPFYQTQLLSDITQPDNMNSPKSKQFLQQFKKTFTKCLSSVHPSRKNSNKINKQTQNMQQSKQNNQTSLMNATFGKPKKNIIANTKNPKYYSQQNQKKQKIRDNYSKIIHTMLKERGNNNKFFVGDKKIQLKYDGDKRQGLKHGNGTLYYSNGLCYEGQFLNGYRHGYGVLRFNHIELYIGLWKVDQINGQGKIRNCAIINKKKSSNCQNSLLNKWISYCGQFRSNRFNGQGTLFLQGGQKFLGNFIGGFACGQGTLYKKNGEAQSGLWKNNLLIEKF